MSIARRRTHFGFVMVEVLLVVVIVGAVAATLLPQISAGDTSHETLLRQRLNVLRKQIRLYRTEHDGRLPATGSALPEAFEDAMLLSSDADGTVGPLGTKPFGPYLIEQLPANPYTGGRKVAIVVDVCRAESDDSPVFGWFYSPVTGRLKANCTGTAADGTPLDEL